MQTIACCVHIGWYGNCRGKRAFVPDLGAHPSAGTLAMLTLLQKERTCGCQPSVFEATMRPMGKDTGLQHAALPPLERRKLSGAHGMRCDSPESLYALCALPSAHACACVFVMRLMRVACTCYGVCRAWMSWTSCTLRPARPSAAAAGGPSRARGMGVELGPCGGNHRGQQEKRGSLAFIALQ
eukprot:1143017-Pelagomonas_calceolata.AAC.3